MTKPTFEQLAAQLHAELEVLFERWPELHPRYRERMLAVRIAQAFKELDERIVKFGDIIWITSPGGELND